MRRRLPWLLSLPLMAAGSLAAHSLSYLFVSARAAEGAGEVSERASTGSSSYLVLFLGVLAATGVGAAGARPAPRCPRPPRPGASPAVSFSFAPPPLPAPASS